MYVGQVGNPLWRRIASNWVKGDFSPKRAALTPGVHGPCYCLGVVLCWPGEQCALCGLHPEAARWYFWTRRYVLQFCMPLSVLEAASWRDCNNPRLIYFDKKLADPSLFSSAICLNGLPHLRSCIVNVVSFQHFTKKIVTPLLETATFLRGLKT